MSKRAFKSFQLSMTLMEIHPFLNWMRNSGMPFLAKLNTQIKWTNSKGATAFFARFTSEHAKGRLRNGKEEPVKLDLKVMRQRDWPMIETYIRLSFPQRKVGVVRRRKRP